jgi:ABC-type siderophore export system fused ATPase/permease subunit
MTSKYGVYGFGYRYGYACFSPGWQRGMNEEAFVGNRRHYWHFHSGGMHSTKHLSSSPFHLLCRYSSFLNTTQMLFYVQIHLIFWLFTSFTWALFRIALLPIALLSIALLSIALLSVALLLYSLLLHLYLFRNVLHSHSTYVLKCIRSAEVKGRKV